MNTVVCVSLYSGKHECVLNIVCSYAGYTVEDPVPLQKLTNRIDT